MVILATPLETSEHTAVKSLQRAFDSVDSFLNAAFRQPIVLNDITKSRKVIEVLSHLVACLLHWHSHLREPSMRFFISVFSLQRQSDVGVQ
jgi:hypothetical protein